MAHSVLGGVQEREVLLSEAKCLLSIRMKNRECGIPMGEGFATHMRSSEHEQEEESYVEGKRWERANYKRENRSSPF